MSYARRIQTTVLKILLEHSVLNHVVFHLYHKSLRTYDHVWIIRKPIIESLLHELNIIDIYICTYITLKQHRS
jgi:hypothetical protein